MGFSPGGGGSGAISSSSDVALNTPTNNQVLTYDGSIGKWKNSASSGGAPTYENLPAGSVIVVNQSGGNYAARPTARTDIVVRWRGATVPSSGPIEGDEFLLRDS